MEEFKSTLIQVVIIVSIYLVSFLSRVREVGVGQSLVEYVGISFVLLGVIVSLDTRHLFGLILIPIGFLILIYAEKLKYLSAMFLLYTGAYILAVFFLGFMAAKSLKKKILN